MSKLSYPINVTNSEINVVVVEDEEKLLKNIVEYLKLEAFSVTGFSSSVDALKHLLAKPVDVVISDIKMPGLTGYDLITEVRNNSINKDVVFLFLTAKVEREDIRLGMNLQADDYITKPFAMSDLLESLYSRLKLKNNRVEASKSSVSFSKEYAYSLLEKLTKSEIKVAYLIGLGKTNSQIADRLSISPKTVDNHRTNISDKLNITGRNKLMQLCIENKDHIKSYITEKMRNIPHFF